MKKTILTLSCTMIYIASFSQTLNEALKATYDQFSDAHDQIAMIAASNRFVLIANKWSKEWIAHYYAAYAQSIIGAIEQDNKRKASLFDEAEKSLSQAATLGGSNSDDVYALKAMIASMRIDIEPDQWQKYMEIFSINLKKAKDMRKKNPRLYYIEGMSKFYTPEAYGGGKQAALPYFEKAKEYFDVEKTDDIRKPFWGKKQNEEMIKKCSE